MIFRFSFPAGRCLPCLPVIVCTESAKANCRWPCCKQRGSGGGGGGLPTGCLDLGRRTAAGKTICRTGRRPCVESGREPREASGPTHPHHVYMHGRRNGGRRGFLLRWGVDQIRAGWGSGQFVRTGCRRSDKLSGWWAAGRAEPLFFSRIAPVLERCPDCNE